MPAFFFGNVWTSFECLRDLLSACGPLSCADRTLLSVYNARFGVYRALLSASLALRVWVGLFSV